MLNAMLPFKFDNIIAGYDFWVSLSDENFAIIYQREWRCTSIRALMYINRRAERLGLKINTECKPDFFAIEDYISEAKTKTAEEYDKEVFNQPIREPNQNKSL